MKVSQRIDEIEERCIMQKIFNNKVMAILGLITSIYVIAFLILLIFATMTLLSVATLFNVLMWISIVASVLVIVGLLYTKFGEMQLD